MTFCTKCGIKIGEGMNFCTACGAAVVAPAAVPEEKQTQYPVKPAAPQAQPALPAAVSRSKGLAIAAIVCALIDLIMNIMVIAGIYPLFNPILLSVIRGMVTASSIVLSVFSLYLNRNKLALVAGIIVAAVSVYWALRNLFMFFSLG